MGGSYQWSVISVFVVVVVCFVLLLLCVLAQLEQKIFSGPFRDSMWISYPYGDGGREGKP